MQIVQQNKLTSLYNAKYENKIMERCKWPSGKRKRKKDKLCFTEIFLFQSLQYNPQGNEGLCTVVHGTYRAL